MDRNHAFDGENQECAARVEFPWEKMKLEMKYAGQSPCARRIIRNLPRQRYIRLRSQEGR